MQDMRTARTLLVSSWVCLVFILPCSHRVSMHRVQATDGVAAALALLHPPGRGDSRGSCGGQLAAAAAAVRAHASIPTAQPCARAQPCPRREDPGRHASRCTPSLLCTEQ